MISYDKKLNTMLRENRLKYDYIKTLSKDSWNSIIQEEATATTRAHHIMIFHLFFIQRRLFTSDNSWEIVLHVGPNTSLGSMLDWKRI